MNRKDIKKMWVWDNPERLRKRFVLWYDDRVVTVYEEDEKSFLDGRVFRTNTYHHCKEIKTTTRVKSQTDILRWLADNDFRWDEDHFVNPEFDIAFHSFQFEFCGKEAAHYKWLPEWLEEVEE